MGLTPYGLVKSIQHQFIYKYEMIKFKWENEKNHQNEWRFNCTEDDVGSERSKHMNGLKWSRWRWTSRSKWKKSQSKWNKIKLMKIKLKRSRELNWKGQI